MWEDKKIKSNQVTMLTQLEFYKSEEVKLSKWAKMKK